LKSETTETIEDGGLNFRLHTEGLEMGPSTGWNRSHRPHPQPGVFEELIQSIIVPSIRPRGPLFLFTNMNMLISPLSDEIE
jgi:hypothetical protein